MPIGPIAHYSGSPPSGDRPLNRATQLHGTPDLSVSCFDHPPHEVHQDPEREVAERWSIAFVRAGSFDVSVGGGQHRLAVGSVFITRPGLEFRCAHHHESPDDVCVSVSFSPAAVAEAEHAWERTHWWATRVAPPRLGYVQHRMELAVEEGDLFGVERWAIGALLALESCSGDSRARGHYAVTDRDIEPIVATCRAIETNPAARLSIADRAGSVGFTSTRLTHGFRRYLGVSPHQYVVRHRLAVASTHLNEGLSVSESCYCSGFENLSHFCRTFQRSFGVRPSAWRTLARTESRRKVQDLLGGRR